MKSYYENKLAGAEQRRKELVEELAQGSDDVVLADIHLLDKLIAYREGQERAYLVTEFYLERNDFELERDDFQKEVDRMYNQAKENLANREMKLEEARDESRDVREIMKREVQVAKSLGRVNVYYEYRLMG